ncbi:MAG: anhydro-N-acetylmuramic acid kinase [Alphaproteobacteria bacterium]
MLALGLMTGTALDGFIDAALVETDGLEIQALGAWRLHPYGELLRVRLQAAVNAARAWNFTGPPPPAIAAAERDYTLAHAEAVRALLAAAGLKPADVDIVGMHGLTLLHRGSRKGVLGATLQLGDGALLARELGVDVAFDFRSADVAAGGQGSPLTPIYHAALLRFSKIKPPAAALNLGGVGNVTWVGADGDLIAFDTGPANGPINEWMEAWGKGAFDEGGKLAARGRVHEALIDDVLSHPYFWAPYPKSLDRYDFNCNLVRGLTPEDGAATLTALVAASVGRGLDLLPERPMRLVVCGGGRKNPVMVRELRKRADVDVVSADEVGWRGDAIEAEAFAYLAVRALKDLPVSFPTTTGVVGPSLGGRIARGR